MKFCRGCKTNIEYCHLINWSFLNTYLLEKVLFESDNFTAFTQVFIGNLQKCVKDGCEINYIIYLNHFYSHKTWIICTFSDLKKCILCNFDCSKILDDICYNYELNWMKYSVWCHYSKFLLNWGSVCTDGCGISLWTSKDFITKWISLVNLLICCKKTWAFFTKWGLEWKRY